MGDIMSRLGDIMNEEGVDIDLNNVTFLTEQDLEDMDPEQRDHYLEMKDQALQQAELDQLPTKKLH